MKDMLADTILIWNEKTGFIRITEGSGCNLLPEDEEEGYVDYINVDGLEYDGFESFEECYDPVEGGMAMLTELYQEMFETQSEVIQYLIDAGWIPDVDYAILYAE